LENKYLICKKIKSKENNIGNSSAIEIALSLSQNCGLQILSLEGSN